MNSRVIRHRSREVAQALGRSIRRGEMPVGSYLPPARALATQFGVSLNTVQVALRELETLSLIQSIPRRGTLVKNAEQANAPKRPPQIGVVVPMVNEHQIRDLWGMRILQGAEEQLFDSGSSLVFMPYMPQAGELIAQVLTRIERLGEQLGGVICFSNPGVLPLITELEVRHIPYVTINRPEPGVSHNFVATDNLEVGRIVGRCFGLLGYERVAILTSDVAFDPASLEKVTGFFQGRLEVNSTTKGVELITCADWRADWREQDGYDAICDLLNRGMRPQGVFAAGDLLGVGAIRALTEAGISVPNDVGVVGGTGVVRGDECQPRLTVVAQSMEQIGRHAAKMILEMIDGDIRRIIGRKIAGKLVLRDSLLLSDAVKVELESAARAGDEFMLESPVLGSESAGKR